MDKTDKIFIAGHTGMTGSALLSEMSLRGFSNIVTSNRKDIDLVNQSQVATFFSQERPDYVLIAAGKTGGIYANNGYCADFLYENLMIQNNIIHQSFLHEVKKLIFFACSAVYPKDLNYPILETDLLSGQLENMTESGAVAKIAGLKMCESYNRQYGTDFISLIPTNIYGPKQHYDPMDSMVVPAFISKFHRAKTENIPEVTIFGDGSEIRDFLHVDDLVSGTLFLLEKYNGNDYFNIASGYHCSIMELAEIIKTEVGYKGKIVYDKSSPSGIPMKVLNISRINSLGWKSKVIIQDGIHRVYTDFLNNNKMEPYF
jgi:GDP-L-fucose synthase